MRQRRTTKTIPPPLTRRDFVQAMFATGVIAGIDSPLSASEGQVTQQTSAHLTGTHFDLIIESRPVNITGRHSRASVVNGTLPGPTMRWREGDVVTVAVTNRLNIPTSIHWHGIRLPSEMDGVPGLSFAGINPGETFVYRIPVHQNGTYWYHSHSGDQEQTGLSGALILEPKVDESVDYDREYVIFLTDWTDDNPNDIFRNLKEDGEYYNVGQRTAGTFVRNAKKDGLKPTIYNRMMWGKMNMTPTDISDVSGATYKYLLNGLMPDVNWTGLFTAGERVRLRFINGSSMTFFDVRIPGLMMTVVQADGNAVEPIEVEEFRIADAETYDVIVEPSADRAYTIFAQAYDRSGYARGTLAPAPGMTAAVPALDARPVRTMVDMGMGMGSMDGAAMKMPEPNSSMTSQQDMPEMADGATASSVSEMRKVANMPQMSAGGDSSRVADIRELRENSILDRESYSMPLPQPSSQTPRIANQVTTATSVLRQPRKHLHIGPQIDGLSMAVSERLADPGDGLQGNGRRVLAYSDLRARYPGVDGRSPSREIEIHITGNMQRYIWGFDGKKFTDAEPIQLALGERIRFIFINDSMMDHPIHLHGVWSELENGHGAFNPYKHTVIVKPSERVSYVVSADTPGRWALHCHLLLHMRAGMFRTVVIS